MTAPSSRLLVAPFALAAALVAGGASVAFGQTPAPAKAPTFTKDVAPILQRSCQNCHRPGSIAPMSLLTYEDARPWARSMKNRVSLRQMPPWHVDKTIGIRKFKDDPSLSDAEVATVVGWVDAGAPRGNPADMPPPRVFDDSDKWHIGKPDDSALEPTRSGRSFREYVTETCPAVPRSTNMMSICGRLRRRTGAASTV